MGQDKPIVLFTVSELATAYKVKEATVRAWLRKGIIQGTKFDRIWRIPEAPEKQEPKA